jgi:glycosidase
MMRRVCIGVVLTFALTLAPALPGPLGACAAFAEPAVYTPSPADWRDVPIYQIFTDRFFDGNPANNNAEGSYDPGFAGDGTWYSGNVHGGDFAGVLEKLDYIQGLGFKAIWISPVVVNVWGEHHGYAARDFKAIAPHFGTQTELRALADALHARGMYLVVDVVCNHMGDMIDSGTSGYPTFHDDPSPYVLRWRTSKRPGGLFNNLTWFHNNGGIQNWVDPDQVLGELSSLDDLKTESPAVIAGLDDAMSWLIDVTDCDGFRIDTVKHGDMPFWQTWTPLVRAHAASLGKNNFFFYGEVFDGSDAKCGSYTGTKAGGAFALDSVLYFPMTFTMNDVFAYNQRTSRITDRYAALGNYDAAAQERLVSFLDNHDVARFLSSGVAAQDATKLNAALDFMLTARGVPCVYQGTEQAFDGGADPYDREDMWDGAWDYGPSLGDNFNMTHPLYKRTRDLNDIRSRYDALRTGAFTELKSEAVAGIYAFRRAGAVEDVVVVLNSSSASRASGTLATGWASGTALADLRDPSFSLSVGSGGSISLTVPARRARILVRSSAVTAATPAVDTQSPSHAGTTASPRPAIRLGFNRAMNHASVEAAFSMVPSVPGAFSWEADSAVVFTPSQDWSEGSVVALRLEASATSADASPMRAAFESFFTIAGGIPGLVVASGFHATEFASGSGIGVPMGIATGEGGAWSDNLYVGDALNNRVLRITTGGSVSVLASGSFLSKPEGLDFDHAGAYGGDLVIADPNGLLRVTSAGVVSQIASGTNATNTGAVACLPAGPLGGFPYMVSNTSNRVERYEAGTGYVPFASPVNGAEGVAPALGMFGFGRRLLVADPDLAAYASSIDGTSSIFFADSTGALSTFVQNPTLLNGVCAMVVDTQGQFGGDLLVANIATETVLRITPAGAISVLASGFGNLFASDCLTIGPDGALYVVDSGSGEPFTDSSGGTAVARIVRVAADTSTGTPGGGGEPPPPFLSIFPNPLTGAGTARFRLEREAMVTLDLFDIRGRRVATPFAGVLPAGPAEVRLDLSALSLARGVYFARVVADGASVSSTRVVLR